MKVFGVSVLTLVLFAAVFVVGAKWGTGIVSQIPGINQL
jgi:hypothetical protein